LDVFFSGITESGIAMSLRFSRWSYAFANGFHILGISLLLGSIIPMDLKLLGAWPKVQRTSLVRVLVPMAALGLLLAIFTGGLLFSIRADEYAYFKVFQFKMALVAIGICSSLFVHLRFGLWLERGTQRNLLPAAIISIVCWLSALTAGRMIAFISG